LPDNGEKPDEGAQKAVVQAPEPVPPRYVKSNADRELRQSEIITNLSQFIYDPETEQVAKEPYAYAIILTQDCDLVRDFEAGRDGKALVLSGVLIYPLQNAADARPLLPGVRWQPVTQNNNERFQFFPEIPSECDCLGEGLPALLMDFRRYFTIPGPEICRQTKVAAGAKRRCYLNTPYWEHLQIRAAFYFQRVALP
jgi:hypothetical protein